MSADLRRGILGPPAISLAVVLLATPAQAIDGVCVRYCGGSGWLGWAIWAGEIAAEMLANQAAKQSPPAPRQQAPRQQARQTPEKPRAAVVPQAGRPAPGSPTTRNSPPPKWADCHATGGVWGHNGTCGHPANTPGLPAQPPLQWTELQLPPSIPRPQSAGGIAASPPPPPPVALRRANAGDCIGAPVGTATFGITPNPDRPSLDCGPATQPPLEDAAWTELTAKQLYAYQINKSPTDISRFPQVADRGGVPDMETADQTLSKKMMYRDCLRLRVSESSTSATLENRCSVTLRYSVCFINSSGGINPMIKVGSPEIGPAVGEGALPDSAVDHDPLGKYFKFDDNSRRFVPKRPVPNPGVIDDVPTIRSYQGVKLRAEPAYGPRTAELDCLANGGLRGDIESIAGRDAGQFRQAGPSSDLCEPINWRLSDVIDNDLQKYPLNVLQTACADPTNENCNALQNACADPTNVNCIRLNKLVSSITVPEFRKFVKTTVNFSIRRYSESAGKPITAACLNKEYPDPRKCNVSIYPEFWKIGNATQQELLLILETGKIQSMLNRGIIPNYQQLRAPSSAHLDCLGGPGGRLGDFGDDSRLGLYVIGAIPIKSRQ
jgi:hypothetical protein